MCEGGLEGEGHQAAHRGRRREYGDEWVEEEKQMNEKWAEYGTEMDWRGEKNRWMRNKGTWKAWETKEMHYLMGIMEDWQIYKTEDNSSAKKNL